MDIEVIILFAGVLIFAAHFFGWLFSFTKLPDVLLLILVGIALGPILGVLTPDFFGQAGGLFSIIVLAIILFEGGATLRLDAIRETWRDSLKLTLLNLILVIGAIGSLLWWLTDLGPLLSFMVGAIVSGTASVVIIPLLEQLKITGESRAIMLLESAVTDVTSVVLTIALLRAYQLGTFSVAGFITEVVLAFVVAAVIGVAGGFLWSMLLNKVRHMQNSIFTTPAYLFILFGITEALGFSGPIAALMFGVTMGNIGFFKVYLEQKHHIWHTLLHPLGLNDIERTFFSEVVFLLKTFFFVYVGMSITFGNPAVLGLGVFLVMIMFMMRIPAVRLTIPSTIPAPDAALMAVMVPIGLAGAVLASLPLQAGIPGGQFIQDVTYMMILISVIITSLLIFLISRTSVGRVYQRLAAGRVETPGQTVIDLAD